MQNDTIVLVIPYTKEKSNSINSLINLCEKRAEFPITVYTVLDTIQEGWINIHNRMSKILHYDWYIYGCDDYFPGRGFVRLALECAKKNNKRMVGFNDGKWHGTNATTGMIHKDVIKGDLFYSGYVCHGADPDLTQRMILQNEYVYCPEALFVEIDYYKDFKMAYCNKQDMILYQKRKSNGFKDF